MATRIDVQEAPALQWRLHTVMSERGIRSSAELHRRLQSRKVDITHRQLARIVSQLPQRLSTELILALMVELDCRADELLRLSRTGRRQVKATPTKASVAEAPRQEGGEPPVTGADGTQPPATIAPAPDDGVCGPDMSSLVLRLDEDELG
ncbi:MULTISPECIES: helix-turn-helix domain-containing protein [unclassified Variovorax]|uniref:helix-turn-helix domain-containing protein n=1 Tax=unclassified Variovorax TaxID=663243 RepID=UPI001316AF37|nr:MULTISPECIES: helix-turn-helix transcriptional regulator [unclassified Variovorax]VTU42349.1 hypothetical protein H6P1_00164 [Variovorax sp. PBL-H6]VTU44027.1 hypothetical protein SRS16P1_00738 [Variovorax sp. SRS16]VTU44112.1 hypothetical protein E5P1_00731 [Variovorax sp. PBL-E5]